MARTTTEDLRAALRSIIVASSAYHAQGSQMVIEQMVRTAKQALDGEWGGVTLPCVHCAEGRR